MNKKSENDALQRFETIWEHVECGIAIIDAETRKILAINPVAARMFGDDINKIVGKSCHRFICPAEHKSCPIMDLGQVVDRAERLFVRSDGKTIPIIKSVAKIQYNGRLALLESFTDISTLKEAEKKLRLLKITEEGNRAKSDFLSRMSHEMRTPLNAIIGMTKITEDSNDIARLKYCLSMISVSADHLLGLINDVLDMSKIEAGKLELELAPLNLEQILIKNCSLISEKADERKISMRVDIDRHMNLNFIGDELRLSQVIINLLSNAVKFTPSGGEVSITARELEKKPGKSVVQISIADTGIGLSTEQKARLFNAFEQADSSTSRRFGGTGLGLVISKSLVEKMNGQITIDSEPGKGSVFSVEVELARPEKEHGHTDGFIYEPAACAFELKNIRVLVLDDDEKAMDKFRTIASRSHFRVEQAKTVALAKEMIVEASNENEPFDVIVIDYDLSAQDMVKALHSFAKGELPGFDPAKVVLMTTFLGWSHVEEEARQLGISHFLIKPLFPSTVLKSICKVITPPQENIEPKETVPDLSQVNILLVEDIDINREIFVTLLEDTGVQVDEVEDGLGAIEKFQSNPDLYDLIVMDVQMPRMDGFQATKAIRSMTHERARSIPIIALTANVFKTDLEQCLKCGMDDLLPKPIDRETLFETLVKYSKEQRQPRL